MLDHITVEGQPAAHGTGNDLVVLDDQDAHLPPPVDEFHRTGIRTSVESLLLRQIEQVRSRNWVV